MENANILVVAKDRAIIDKLKNCFEDKGHQIIPAYDVSLGFFLAQKNFPHIILCQEELKDGDAFELLGELGADPELADIPFILISASARTDNAELSARGITMAITETVSDGYLISELMPLLHEAIAGRKKRQEYSPE